MSITFRGLWYFASTNRLLLTSNTLTNKFIINRGYVYRSQFIQQKRLYSGKINENNLENVYYGVLTPQIKAVKVVSFTTSVTGLIAQPILYNHVVTMGGSLPVIIGLSTFVGFFTFVTPLLLHFVTKKYITHLDYNHDTNKYVATVLSFFCMKKQIEFTPEDVKVPDVPGMFTSFKVNDIALFVDPRLFTDPQHYGKLMGYDKPIDFKLYEDKKS